MPSMNESARSRRRADTEDKLLDALEIVLQRDGIRQLSLNAIVEEADVAKPLLYRYFNNLQGLLSAWAERRGPWPADDLPDLPGDETDVKASAGNETEFMRQLTDRLIVSAESLREQPVLLEMLAEELTADSEISMPFKLARRRRSKTFVRMMLSDARYTEPAVRARIIVIYAAITYLAMRAHRSPNFMGLKLNTNKGWGEAMDMVRLIMST